MNLFRAPSAALRVAARRFSSPARAVSQAHDSLRCMHSGIKTAHDSLQVLRQTTWPSCSGLLRNCQNNRFPQAALFLRWSSTTPSGPQADRAQDYKHVGATSREAAGSQRKSNEPTISSPEQTTQLKASQDGHHHQQQEGRLAEQKASDLSPRENIFTIPNLLCVFRIGLSPFIGYSILHSDYQAALAMLALAALSDLFDGYIARTFKQATVFGSNLDPLADKILMTTLTISLGYTGVIPTYLAYLIIGRDVALIAAGFVLRWISLPKPRTFSRYFNASLPTAEMKPTFISKVNTVLQLLLLGLSTASIPFDFTNHPYLVILQQIVAVTTVWSAFSYLYTKNVVRFIAKKPLK